ncbi:MAG: ribose-phosphate pyrophosphokinase [bacterium]
MNDLMLFAGNSNPELADGISRYLELELSDVMVGRFADGEIQVEIHNSVRHKHVYVIQSLSWPVNDNLMELLVLGDTLRRASADEITAVIPYFGYARQDRQAKPRTPITAKLVADMIQTAGFSRVITMELHASQIQGFFTKPVDNIFASPVLIQAVKSLEVPLDQLVIVSPDAGGVERARHYSNVFGCPMAIVDKRRSAPGVAHVMHLIGDVTGKTAVLVDDMIDTAGTLTQAADALMQHGAKAVFAAATHPVLSGPAIQRINDSPIERVFVTDTIPLNEAGKACSKIRVCSVSNIIGEAIRRVHGGDSVSSLFKMT